MRGSYLLFLRNERRCSVRVGRLGNIVFNSGVYVYVGSGLNNVVSRVGRHFKSVKRVFWHIDYIASRVMRIIGAILLISDKRLEGMLSSILKDYYSYVPGFGASDTKDVSHLFYIHTESKYDLLVSVISNVLTYVTDVYWYDGIKLHKVRDLAEILNFLKEMKST